jgi:hypothetical protein
MSKVLISTGDLKQNYEILDAIFALDSHTAGLFTSANPEKAFGGVKEQLIKSCSKLGGNAVINCQFEYRMAIGKHNAQTVEIFAYGTAVRTI